MPDDYSADTRTTGRFAADGSITGRIETAGDTDWFAVALTAGKVYRFVVEPSSANDGASQNPYRFGLHKANGFLVGDEHPGWLTTSVGACYRPDADFTYWVAVSAQEGRTGSYTLSVAEVADHLADVRTTGRVAVGGSATGEIAWASDEDWFAATLEAGKTYRIDLKGRDTGDGTLRDPYLVGIHDANGARIPGTHDHDGGTGRNSRTFFTPEKTGTYHVAAGGDHAGSYTLSVAEVADHLADVRTTGRVAVGGSATGEIGWAGDRDWFAVTLEAGKSYRIDLQGRDSGGGTLRDPYLEGVYDANNLLVPGTGGDDGGKGRDSRTFFTPEKTATYHVAAGAFYRDDTGSYTLSVAEGVPDDYSADTDTAGTVAVGGSATGEIEYVRDRDWFAVTLEADRTYLVDLKGRDTGDGTLANPRLFGIHDANGARLAGTRDDNGGEGRNSRAVFTPEETATYYVAAGASKKLEGAYTLSVVEVVEVGGSAPGEIEWAGEEDWFAVELEGGRTYRIDLKGRDTGDGTLANPYLVGIHDAKGARIPGTHDYDGGKGHNSRTVFTADKDGIYYVAAGASLDDTGSYTLSVAEDVPDDYSADTDTDGAVAVGDAATGEIEYVLDRDWFAVTLETDRTYLVDLKGRDTGDGSLANPLLFGIHDANGARLAGTRDDNGGEGRNSRMVFTPEETATYYVAAGARKKLEGAYILSVVEVVEVGGSVPGEIEWAGDRDWFAATLEAGRTYRIDLKGRDTGDGTLRDPYLVGIHDAKGAKIPGTYDYDGGKGHNSRTVFTADKDGIYYVTAGAGFDDTGSYTLSVEDVI